VNYFYI